MAFWRKQLGTLVGKRGQKPSMKEVSVAIGAGETYVRDILKRDREPTIETFEALAHALGVPITFFFENAGMPPGGDVTMVPLVSWVRAGALEDSTPTSEVGEDRYIPVTDLGRGDFFALRVIGDSMDRFSPEGSTIVVDRADKTLLRDKPYVFADKLEGATYKLWRPGPPPMLAPHSTNPNNQPIFPRRKIHVIGRVRRTILDF